MVCRVSRKGVIGGAARGDERIAGSREDGGDEWKGLSGKEEQKGEWVERVGFVNTESKFGI